MKKLVWPGIILLGIVILLAGIGGLGKFVFSNRFDAEIAKMKAAGEPTTLAELLGKPVPDNLNAAGPYMLIRAEIEGGKYERDLKVIDDFHSNSGAVGPNQGAVSPDQWKAAEDALARTMPLRTLLDDALAHPQCRFEINMQDPLSTMRPQFTVLRRMARWLRADALVSAREGHMDRAADDICAQMAVVESTRGEPFLMDHLVRVALAAISAKTASSCAEHGSYTEGQARRVFDALGSFDIAASYRQGLRGERVMFLHYSDPRNAQEFLATIGYSATGSTTTGQAVARPLVGIYTQTALKGDLAVLARVFTERMDGAGLSFGEAKAKGLLHTPSGLPSYALLSQSLLSSFARVGVRRYEVEAEISQARVFLALQAYRDRVGAYPSDLRQLRSELGWKLPADPFSGKDFIYKRQAKGFVLYSVGPDMIDDGGQPIVNDTVELDDTGDIVLDWHR